MTQSPQTAAKGFTKAFWVSNTVELFERMAYYAVFIVLTIYLSSILGFNDFEASMISGLFSGGLYLLPIFTGAYADKIGFRKSMIVAFSLLSAGYLGLGLLPTLFLICLCVQLCFIEIYGSSDSVGFFVEEAALRKIYSIPATIRKWIGTDTFYLPARSKGLLIPGP